MFAKWLLTWQAFHGPSYRPHDSAPAINLVLSFQSFKSRRVAVHGTEALLTCWEASEAFHVPRIGQESRTKKERMVKVQFFFLLLTLLLSNTWSVWSLGFHLPTMSRKAELVFFLSLRSVKHRNVSLCLLWRQESLPLRGVGHLVIESFNFFCSRHFLCSGHGFGLSQTERETG